MDLRFNTLDKILETYFKKQDDLREQLIKILIRSS